MVEYVLAIVLETTYELSYGAELDVDILGRINIFCLDDMYIQSLGIDGTSELVRQKLYSICTESGGIQSADFLAEKRIHILVAGGNTSKNDKREMVIFLEDPTVRMYLNALNIRAQYVTNL